MTDKKKPLSKTLDEMVTCAVNNNQMKPDDWQWALKEFTRLKKEGN